MAARAVLNGRYAEASLNGVLIALLSDWTVTVTGKTADVTAHGDVWDFKVPLPSGWKFTAKSFVVPASVSHMIHALFASATLPPAVTVTGYSGSVASGTPIFAGTGYPIKGELAAPMGAATQEFEIEGTGAPTTGVT